jgi:uridine kinase
LDRQVRLAAHTARDGTIGRVRTALSYIGLARRLRGLPPSCGPVRLVAVDGPAGSGKTTFAGRLGQAAGAQVIHSDDFPVAWDGPPDSWFPMLDDQVLRPLSGGAAGAYRRFDWVRGTFAERVEVPPAPVLVIEGVGAARRASADLIAFTIWVEAPEPLRLRRGLSRDGAAYERQWRTWMRTEEEWFARDDSRRRADLRVDVAALFPRHDGAEFVVTPTDGGSR